MRRHVVSLRTTDPVLNSQHAFNRQNRQRQTCDCPQKISAVLSVLKRMLGIRSNAFLCGAKVSEHCFWGLKHTRSLKVEDTNSVSSFLSIAVFVTPSVHTRWKLRSGLGLNSHHSMTVWYQQSWCRNWLQANHWSHLQEPVLIWVFCQNKIDIRIL